MCMECLNGCGCLRALVCVGVGGPVCVLVLHGRVCPLVGGYGVAARCACLLVGMMWVRGVHACRKVWCGCEVCILVGVSGVGVFLPVKIVTDMTPS